MPETITVTKDQLYAVMLDWEQQARQGLTTIKQWKDGLAEPVEKVAQDNTDDVWNALQKVVAA